MSDVSSALLIYPFGVSDLQFPEESPPRGVDLATRVAPILDRQDLSLQWSRGDQHSLEWRAGDTPLAHMPILGDTLSLIESSLVRGEIWLQPIVTNQSPPGKGDTIALVPLLERLESMCSHATIVLHILPHWEVHDGIYDYGKMASTYRDDLYHRYTELVRKLPYSVRYIQVTPGPPAMSFATVAFGQDPDLQFLYTPIGHRTRAASLLGDEQKHRTDHLMSRLLEQLDWGAIHLVLKQPGNGYTPLTGPHPKKTAIRRAYALDTWRRREYHQAQERLNGDDAVECPLDTLCENLALLQGDHSEVTDWTSVWAWAQVDAFNRLLISRYLQDQAGFILALYSFNDACLLWGLSREYPEVNFHKEPDAALRKILEERIKPLFPEFAGNFQSETSKLQSLLAFRDTARDGVAFQSWLEAYLLLHWVLNTVIDDVRNALVHGVAHLPSTLLKERLERIGIAVSNSAMDQFIMIAYSALNVLPGRPDHLWPVWEVNDGIRADVGGSTDGTISALADCDEVVAIWKAAWRKVILSVQTDITNEMQAQIDRCRERVSESFPTVDCQHVLTRLSEPVDDTPKAVHIVHGLVGKREGDRPYLEALVSHLSSVQGSFDLIRKCGNPATYIRYIREWLAGTSWDGQLKGYIEALSKGPSAPTSESRAPQTPSRQKDTKAMPSGSRQSRRSQAGNTGTIRQERSSVPARKKIAVRSTALGMAFRKANGRKSVGR